MDLCALAGRDDDLPHGAAVVEMVFRGFSMVFLWFYHGFAMALLWFYGDDHGIILGQSWDIDGFTLRSSNMAGKWTIEIGHDFSVIVL